MKASGIWPALLMTLSVLVPIVGVVAILGTADDRLSPITPDADAPLTVTVDPLPVRDLRPVVVDLARGDRQRVAGAGRDGLVESVLVERGDALSTGDVVYEVNGVEVMALASDIPLEGAIDGRSRPEQIRAVSELLVALELLDGPDSRWSAELQSAVRVHASMVGADEGSGSFDSSLVVWLPEAPFRVAEVSVMPGWTAPSRSEVALAGPAPLVDVSVRPESRAAVTTALLPGRYVASLDGERLGPWRPGEPMPPDTRSVMAGRVDPDLMSATVQVALEEPVVLASLPAEAVITDSSATTCIWTAGSSPTPVVVDVVRTLPGTVEIRPISIDEPVLADPRHDPSTDPSCTP